MELMQAFHQWATRPNDERFLSLHAMQEFKNTQRSDSRSGVVSSRRIEVRPVDDDPTHKGLMIHGQNGNGAVATHWSFGQLATLAKSPAGYLRSLPAPIAADCLNYGFKFMRDIEDVGILLHRDDNMIELRAATGPKYGRIWDSDVLFHLIDYVGDGVSGQWKVPGEFGKPVTVNRQNTTLYASDRDMFVFLTDENNLIEVPNRRNGETGAMSRGFFVWNSEVGSKTFGVSTFLFDYVCMNRIIWGARDIHTVKIRHTASAPDRFLEDAVPALEDYANSSSANITNAIENARAKRLDDVGDFLAKRFNAKTAKRIMEQHEVEEGRPIETIWDAVTGVTAVAKDIQHVDARVVMEQEGGKLLDLVA